MGITAGSGEVPGRNACDKRHPYRIIITIIIIIITIIINSIGLPHGGNSYITCIQNRKLVTTKFKFGGLHEKHILAT